MLQEHWGYAHDLYAQRTEKCLWFGYIMINDKHFRFNLENRFDFGNTNLGYKNTMNSLETAAMSGLISHNIMRVIQFNRARLVLKYICTNLFVVNMGIINIQLYSFE